MKTASSEKWIIRTTDYRQSEFPKKGLPISRKELTFSSLKKLGSFWVLAVISVVIPVLHFVLVPLFLVMGVVAFFRQMKNTHFLKDGEFICPSCSRKSAIKNFYFENGKRFQCKTCHNQLVVETLP